MTSDTTSTFETARQEEGGLNERQRQVLDLIEQGHTNREIADMLGITLDGAKWNVSEILTKLCLASREEAAEYLRWRRGSPARQLARRLGGIVGIPVVRWAGVGVAATVVGLVAVLVLSQGDDSSNTGLPPFYLEATVSVIDRSETGGTNVAGGLASPDGGELRESVIRWWARDRDYARFEVETTRPIIDSGTKTIVVDGTNQWVYDDTANSYTKNPMAALPAEIRTRPFTFSIFAGPWFYEAADIDQVLEQLRRFSQVGGHAEVVGHETILGRDATIIEYGPTASRGSSAPATPSGQPAAAGATPEPLQVEYYGVGRIYLDVERMFILGYETESDGQNIHVRVTKLEYGTRVPDDRVRFTPPRGAIEARGDGTGTSGSGSDWPSGSGGPGGGSIGFTVPAGFYGTAYVPEGYRAWGTSSDSSGTDAVSFELIFRDDAGNSLRLEERKRPNGLPASMAQGDEVTVHGVTAYFALDAAKTTLAWYERGIALLASSDSLSRSELLRVAEGLVAN
jgi:DNA-binding CsgD family transcriptional regulator